MAKETVLVVDDDISRTLHKYPPEQLLEVIAGLKPLIQTNITQAKEILTSNSDLTYSVFQSMLLMGLVDDNVVREAISESAKTQSASPEPQEATKPVRAAQPAPEQPKPAADPAQTLEAKLNALDPQQATMIRQVLALTEEQIALLPKEQQGTIQQLRAEYS